MFDVASELLRWPCTVLAERGSFVSLVRPVFTLSAFALRRPKISGEASIRIEQLLSWECLVSRRTLGLRLKRRGGAITLPEGVARLERSSCGD